MRSWIWIFAATLMTALSGHAQNAPAPQPSAPFAHFLPGRYVPTASSNAEICEAIEVSYVASPGLIRLGADNAVGLSPNLGNAQPTSGCRERTRVEIHRKQRETVVVETTQESCKDGTSQERITTRFQGPVITWTKTIRNRGQNFPPITCTWRRNE